MTVRDDHLRGEEFFDVERHLGMSTGIGPTVLV
jgi:polyisoprenoid-binding protein YceI